MAQIRDRLKKTYAQMSDLPAGQRFKDQYKRRHEKKDQTPPWKYHGLTILGVFLVLLGILGGFSPGMPGIIFGIPGLAIISSRSITIARIMDKADLLLCKVLGWIPWDRLKSACKR